MELLFSDTYTIRPFETGTGSRLTLPGFLDLFQDLAGRHATRLGFGMDTLLSDGTAWILSKLAVEVGVLPQVGETLRIETWPSGLDGLYASRDVRAFDAQGGEVARGTTRWLLLDVNRRRPRRAPESMQRFIPEQRPAPYPLPELPRAAGEPLGQREVHARHADLDVNRHVNNVRYAEWMAEAFDDAFLDAHVQTHLVMTFRAETGRGDVLTTEARPAEDDAGGYAHRIIRSRDARDVATGWSRWKAAGPT